MREKQAAKEAAKEGGEGQEKFHYYSRWSTPLRLKFSSKYLLLKKHPKKLSGKSAALFPFAIFVVSSKVRIKSHTSFEELLMSVLSRCQ